MNHWRRKSVLDDSASKVDNLDIQVAINDDILIFQISMIDASPVKVSHSVDWKDESAKGAIATRDQTHRFA
jgi:hypothetical protein